MIGTGFVSTEKYFCDAIAGSENVESVDMTFHDKLIVDKKLENSERTSDARIFVESIFPAAFGTTTMESFMESQESYSALFEDQSKYNAVMSALARVIYREMRSV